MYRKYIIISIFIIIFLFVNIIYNLFVIRKEKALKQMKNNKELLLLCKLNNIDVNKLDLKNAVKLFDEKIDKKKTEESQGQSYSVNYRGYTILGRLIVPKAGINTVSITNPVASPMDSAAMQYERMGKELVKATKKYAQENNCEEKKILYSICEWGWNKPWKWGGKAGNIWRTTGDIQPNWASVMGIYEFNVRLDKYAGPGAFNDPDMLEVGNGNLTFDENKSHFTLWSMMAAPLILGNDIRSFIKEDGTVDKDNKVLQILTNKEVIAVNQDKLGIQCKRIKAGLKDILVKPLENNEVAVCFFNKTNSNTQITCNMADIHNVVEVSLPNAESYTFKELWFKTEETVTDKITTTVAPHGVKVFRISANQ